MHNTETSRLLVMLYAEYKRLTCCDDADFSEAVARAIAALTIVGEEDD